MSILIHKEAQIRALGGFVGEQDDEPRFRSTYLCFHTHMHDVARNFIKHKVHMNYLLGFPTPIHPSPVPCSSMDFSLQRACSVAL